MERKRSKQEEDQGNCKDLIKGPRRSSRLLQKRLKLENVGDVSVSGKAKLMPSNPLLIDLVVENVFSYLENLPPRCLKNLRLVCKLWDRKIKETLRRKTEIDVIRLVSPYPEGLGWTAEGSGENGEPSHIYQCPYPVEPNFENLKVIGTCKGLKNVGVIHWFERMGTNVKSFHFQSPLNCYHQTRFLECVLKRWCNNLRRLHLHGFVWNRLTAVSSCFNNDPFLMDKFEEIIVNGESEDGDFGVDCVLGLDLTYLNYPQSEKSNEDIVRMDMKSPDDSGGVWENIISHMGSEKLIIKNLLPKTGNSYCEELFPSSVMSKKQVRLVETLKHFEYKNFLMFQGRRDLSLFRKMQFPITKLCFGPLPAHFNGSCVTSLLESLSATLQHLEFHGNLLDQSRPVGWRFVTVHIPPLPHLRFFKNGNIMRTQIGSLDFVRNLPNLETCSLDSGWETGPNLYDRLFDIASFQMSEPHNLKKLELIGKKPVKHIKQLRKLFPNLRSLAVAWEGEHVVSEFSDLRKKIPLEDIKIYTNDNNSNTHLISYICDMPSLRFLELVYLTRQPFHISLNVCKNGFARAPELTSLKLKNVSMFEDERESIVEALSNISYVSLTDCFFQVRPKPTNLEFFIGSDLQFPAID